MRLLRIATAVALLWLVGASAAFAQASVALWCWNPNGSQATNNQFLPCSSTNPLIVSLSSSGGGNNVNIAQIGGSNVAAGAAAGVLPIDALSGSNLDTDLKAPIPAGTNTIGNVNGANNVTPVDCSGTITSGGTAQNAFAAGATLHGFTIQNISTDPLWISFTGTAVVGATASYLLQAGSPTAQGGSFSTPFGFGMNTALSVIAATTGDKFSCTWW